MTPILARDLPLARVLGARVQRKKIGHTHNIAETHIVRAIEACREVAATNKISAREVAKKIKRCGPCSAKCACEVATACDLLDHDPLRAAERLAVVFELPWVLGPLRVLPSGAFEITLGEGWVPATEDTLRALDAERRLGAREKVVHVAVTVLLGRIYDARRDSKEGTP